MKPSDNEIEMLAAGFAIQHKNGLIRFAHALLEKYASARAIAFEDWLAKHCDSDDLTAYERELAWDAWSAALSAPQASEAVRDAVARAKEWTTEKNVKEFPRTACAHIAELSKLLLASGRGTDLNHPIFAFLLGEGPLRGVHFGDRHPDERGAYWWRKDLRAALSAQPGAQKIGGSDA